MRIHKQNFFIFFYHSYRSPAPYAEYNETSIVHALTGWLPEPIPLK